MSVNDISKQLLNAFVKIEEQLKNRSEVKQGVRDNISGIVYLAKKVVKRDTPKTIGIFGAQKRGKSSLINRLLGCDIMPVHTIPMSSVAIEIKHDGNMQDGKFDVVIENFVGKIENNKNVDLNDAKTLLEQYGSHKNESLSSDVETIKVKANFSDSKILKNGGILIDTPGAEKAFGRGAGEELSPEDEPTANDKDYKRAEKILQSAHFVVFVERADYAQSINSKEFFTKHIKPLRPLTVVNFKDTYELDSDKVKSKDPNFIERQKQNVLSKKMLENFGVNLGSVLCISCKEAAEAKEEDNEKKLELSNLPKLERRILAELDNLKPEVGLLTCLKELQQTLSLLEKELVQEVITKSRAKVNFHVILSISENKEDDEIRKKVQEIYDEYGI